MPKPNTEQLVGAAEILRPLLGELVFVGGSVAGLLVTDEAAGDPRQTLDVDAIVEITSYAEYAAFGDRLSRLGFSADTSEGAPLCRWVHKAAILDVMPLDEKILGFSNRWYRAAIETASTRRLSRNLEIRVVTAPLFLATKLEAFRGRGKRDFLGSRDLADVIFVVDGRPSIADEVRAGISTVRDYLSTEIGGLLASRKFIDALPGFLHPDPASQARIGLLLRRLEELASQ